MVIMKCLDTYALVEISRGNAAFLPYLEEDIIICDLTLAEFYGVILREHNELTAEYWLKKLRVYAQPAVLGILVKASKFRMEHSKERISFFDAVGYLFAKENGHLFVTGDKAFEKMKAVEFMKKYSN